MGLLVSLDKKKLKFFLKLRPSEIAHFVGTVSGNKKHIHDLIVLAYFGLWRPSKWVNSAKKSRKIIFLYLGYGVRKMTARPRPT
jgi:hypothetical protein